MNFSPLTRDSDNNSIPSTVMITNTTGIDFGSFCAFHAMARAQGNRPEQQDDTVIISPLDLSSLLNDYPDILALVPQPMTFLAVMDGHGTDGGKVSRSVRDHLVNDIPSHFASAFRHLYSPTSSSCTPATTTTTTITTTTTTPLPILAIHRGLISAYENLHASLTTDPNINAYLSGTTLVTSLITPTHIHIANVGDSRAVLGVLSSKGILQSRILTTDHTCENKEELDRVLKRGARVDRSAALNENNPNLSEQGPLRIYKGDLPYPGLVVTRAIGDSASTALGVLCTPEIIDIPLFNYISSSTTTNMIPPTALVLILASDGVWDGLPGDDGSEAITTIYNVLYRAHSQGVRIGPRVADVAAKKLVKVALQGLEKQQLDDNVSTVCAILTIAGAPPLAIPSTTSITASSHSISS